MADAVTKPEWSEEEIMRWIETASYDELIAFSARCSDTALQTLNLLARGGKEKRLPIDYSTTGWTRPVTLMAITGDQLWFYAIVEELRELTSRMDILLARRESGDETSGDRQ